MTFRHTIWKPDRKRALLHWILAAGWTLLLCYLLLAPSEGSGVKEVSGTFGGTDLTDAVGHVALLLVETFLVFILARHYVPEQRAATIAVVWALGLGTALELAQLWIPARGAALLDVAANWCGAGLFVVLRRYLPR